MQFENSAVASDLKEFKIKINGEEVSEQVAYCVIFQDVFLPVWTCNLYMHDMNNLIMNLPIQPGSDVTVELETKVDSETFDGSKEFKFIVSHIADKKMENEKEYTYTIICVGEDLIKNQKIRVRKCYKDKTVDKHVQSIVSEFLGGDVESEKTDNKLHIIIPNLSPFAAISLLAKSARKKGIADYLFFMKDDKKYVFKSYEKLYGEMSGFEFKVRPNHIRNPAGNIDLDYSCCITNYQFVEHSDALSAQATGYAGGRLVEFNIVTKQWEEKDYKFAEEVTEDQEKKFWKDDIEDSNSNITFMPAHPGMTSGESIIDQSKEWLNSRKSNLLKIEDNKLIIQVPGGVRGWEGLGKCCKVELPSQQDYDEGEEEDKHFKGQYLIIAVTHCASKEGYFVNYELSKKRLNEKMQ